MIIVWKFIKKTVYSLKTTIENISLIKTSLIRLLFIQLYQFIIIDIIIIVL